MPADYERIRSDNAIAYGTRVESYGRLLADRLYSDRTHFVFELLQNAEDVGATYVHFELGREQLIVRHNGRLFTEANVRAICGLADGTKSDDLTKIGTFGIGFKSVYGYTTAPEVHSGDEHFRIVHYVHPYEVMPRPLEPAETCFVFPFDRTDLNPGEAFSQVKNRLVSLGGNTLLFLRNIQRISWHCEDGLAGCYGREVESEGWPRRVQVWEEFTSGRHSVTYLLFDREVSTNVSAAAPKVELAFRLKTDPKTGIESIIGEEYARLVVFFPTESRLPMKCLLQGPYRTTPARDNVPPKDPWNQRLIQESAKLLVDLLPRLKDMGLLTASFLATLPLLPTDPMFDPFCELLREALAGGEFLPANDGSHLTPANARIPSSSWLRELISDPQLAQLQLQPSLRWISADITPDRSADLWHYLRKELEVEEIKPATLMLTMNDQFLSSQSDEWMAQLYDFLDGHEDLWRQRGVTPYPLREVPYIRLEDGRHVQPFGTNGLANACLPPEDETEFPIVRRAIAANDGAMTFLRKLGLRPPSPIEELFRSILPKYEAGRLGAMTVDEHARDVTRLMAAVDSLALNDRNRLTSQMRSLRFFLAKNDTKGEYSLKSAGQIYLRSPELESYFAGNPDVWYYADHEKLVPLAKETGAASRIRRLSRDVGEAGSDGQDADLDGLDFFLKRLAMVEPATAANKAALLWKMLHDLTQQMAFKDRDRYFTAMLRPARRRARLMPSEPAFLKLLKSSTWLPNFDGELVRPSQISLGELPAAFARDEWLAKQLELRPDAVTKLAETLGTTADAIGEFLKHRDAFRQWIQQQERVKAPAPASELSRTVPASAPAKSPSAPPAAPKPAPERQLAPQLRPAPALPTSKAPDIARRTEKAAEKVGAAETKRYAEVTVNRRVSGGAVEPKAYLRLHHTNEDGDVICQLCDGRMPFKLDGHDHFEAIQFLETYGREIEANHLALCPNCAAEYRYACVTSDALKVSRMLAVAAQQNEEELVVPLELPVHDRLRFTQRHFIDLTAAMQIHEIEPEEQGEFSV